MGTRTQPLREEDRSTDRPDGGRATALTLRAQATRAFQVARRRHLADRRGNQDEADTPPPRGLILGTFRVDGLSGAFRWWAIRPAQNLKPTSYVCPLCDQQLHAMSEHTLLVPEGDASRRRHAHTECVATARKAGRLPTADEWRKTQPSPPRLRNPLRRHD